MKIRKNKKYGVNELLDIEAILESSLRPISPRREFIQDLQKGLIDYTYSRRDQSDVDLKKTILYAFFGFAGLVFVFSLWLRLILVIISTLGMIHSSKNKRQSKFME